MVLIGDRVLHVMVAMKGKEFVVAGLFGLNSFVVALIMAWLFLAPQNFWYSVWHDHAGIAEAIEKFGPLNLHRSGFEDTSRAQRIALFADINRAIHASGAGLKDIQFTTPNHGTQPLLTNAEVVHLQDVANLIDVLKWVVSALFLMWVAQLVYGVKKQRVPPMSRQFIGAGVTLTGLFLIILAIGPTHVFNTLHIWVFPKGHQWFFYYQDSLMSTMMKAPILFGWIAAALIAWAVVFYLALQLFLYRCILPRVFR